jgi:hypothetical protein
MRPSPQCTWLGMQEGTLAGRGLESLALSLQLLRFSTRADG